MTNKFKINYFMTIPYHLQTNGHIERINQFFFNILRKKYKILRRIEIQNYEQLSQLIVQPIRSQLRPFYFL